MEKKSVRRVKNVLDEIRTENVVVIPGEERQRRRKPEDVFGRGGLGGLKECVQRPADGVELFAAEIIVGNGVEKKQNKEQAQNSIIERPSPVHEAQS